MGRKRCSPEQIIGFLRQSEVAQAGNRQLTRIVDSCSVYVTK
jgi:hypothetical protein